MSAPTNVLADQKTADAHYACVGEDHNPTSSPGGRSPRETHSGSAAGAATNRSAA